MKIVSFKICPCYQRVSVLLEFLKIPYEKQFLDMDNVPEWFFELSPGLEPVLEINAQHSIAGLEQIITFLEKEYEQQFKLNLTTMRDQDQDLLVKSIPQYINQCTTQRSSSESDFYLNGRDFFDAMKNLNTRLINTPFFYGKKLSMIDLAWLPVVHRAKLVEQHTGFNYLSPYPEIIKWQAALINLPWVEQTVSPDFKEVFTDFYLNDSTFLGKTSI